MNPLRSSVLAAILLCAISSAFAEPLSVGVGIDKAVADMQVKKYKETGLAMRPNEASNELKFWHVDDGVLIATYSKKDRKITKLSFWFADDRSRSEREEFNLSVLSFDPDSGVMTIQTKQPEGEQDPARRVQE